MNETYISIPLSVFSQLPAEAQAIIMADEADQDERRGSLGLEDDSPVELTVAQVRKLVSGLSEKTMAVLKQIAASPTPEFKLKDIISALPDVEHNGDLRGVWAAITRRTRKVCDDSDVDLFWWKEDAQHNSDGELVDQTGYTSALTHTSFRKVLAR